VLGGAVGVRVSEIRLMERDRKIIREIDRWRVCQGRHIREVAGFSGQRACDRRLRKLIEAGYIRREKILYGVAGIYSNTIKATKREGLPGNNRKIRVEQIVHDIAVLDTAIFLNKKHGIEFDTIKTEIELHRQDGFGVRKHRPDFVIARGGKLVCVEVELTLKAKDRFLKIIAENFIDYDLQIWVVPDMENKIAQILRENKIPYPNIRLLKLAEVQKNG